MLCSIKSAVLILAIGSLGLIAIDRVELAVAESLPVLSLGALSPCGYPLTKSMIPCLIRGLKSPNNLTHRFAAWDLGELGEVATEAAPYLSSVLKEDKGKWERVHACIALGKIALPITKVLPALRLALKDSDRDIRDCAATSLGMVAAKIQNKFATGNLLQFDLNIAKSELKKSLQILQTSNSDFNSEPMERVKKLSKFLGSRQNKSCVDKLDACIKYRLTIQS
jgi:HEAT repeats